MKNRFFINCIFIFFLSFTTNLFCSEIDISAKNIELLKEEQKIKAEGDVIVEDENGIIINADKVLFDKEKNIIDAEENVKIQDSLENNQIESDKIKFFRNDEKILSIGKTLIKIKDLYEILTKDILFENKKKFISSNQKTTIKDLYGNKIELEKFKYSNFSKNLRSQGKIKITDKLDNHYYFDDILINIEEKSIAGSNLKIRFNKNSFGNKENDPRLVAKSAIIQNENILVKNGIFTTCKERKGKCPPWKLKAKKILHDKKKKNIYYDHAVLNIYDVPILYIPKFFHPGPTVKRQSGFLTPSATSSSLTGNGVNLPYYFNLGDHKDLTLTPKLYINENPLIQSEYRHKTKNSFSEIDTSFHSYKEKTNKKLKGTRTHFFAKSDIDLDYMNFEDSRLLLDIQRVSSDNYLKVHNLDSKLVSSKTHLTNSLEANFVKENIYFDFEMNVFENLTQDQSDRFEYVLPNFSLTKNLPSVGKIALMEFNSSGSYREFETNKKLAKLINKIYMKSVDFINEYGFVTNLEAQVSNTNYNAQKTSSYKSESNNYQLGGIAALTASWPLEKESGDSNKKFIPKFMIRSAPGSMRNVSEDQLKLDTNNIFSLNKLSDDIETGNSIILGGNYIYEKKNLNYETFNLALGQVFNLEKNSKMSKQSSLNQKISDLVGDMKVKFSENSSLDYKFSLDQNLNHLNYNEIASSFEIGNLIANISFTEENNNIGSNNKYGSAGLKIDLNNSKSINFETRKNFVTNETEFYNLSYQYENDCLRAALEFNRKFYSDTDLEPSDNLVFTITIIPFGKIGTPSIGSFND